jgi:hypothetical protein
MDDIVLVEDFLLSTPSLGITGTIYHEFYAVGL